MRLRRVDRDRELLEALRRHEPTAAERLVTTYGERAYRLASNITANGQDAEEVVQDAFWTVVRKIDGFRGESAFGSWLYRIVANTAYQKRRGQRSRRRDVSWDDVLVMHATVHHPPVEGDDAVAGMDHGQGHPIGELPHELPEELDGEGFQLHRRPGDDSLVEAVDFGRADAGDRFGVVQVHDAEARRAELALGATDVAAVVRRERRTVAPEVSEAGLQLVPLARLPRGRRHLH